MILDAVQGVLQPYILVLNDYSALVVFSQTELSDSEIKVEQLVKKLYNRFTMYQSFAPDMPIRKCWKITRKREMCSGNFPLMRDTIKLM